MDCAMAMQRRNEANCGVRRRKVLSEKSMGSGRPSEHHAHLDELTLCAWTN
jgi:hypothetical protein